MKITVDTNVLVRVATGDDKAQSAQARQIMLSARSVVVPLPCILEFVWVLRSVYRFSRAEVTQAVQALVESSKIVVDAAAVHAGLRVYAAGGDFADGLIAAAGADMGGEVFISFDRKAVRQISATGLTARHVDEAA